MKIRYATPKRPSRLRRWARRCLIGLVLYALAGVAVGLAGLVENVAPADVAVVLGSKVHRSGDLSRQLKARLDRAVTLFREGRCKTVIASGGVGKEGVDEAVAMRGYLISQGIPADRVTADSSGINTRATALFTAAYMKERGLSRVIIVSQYFHILRSRIAFAQAGMRDVGAAYARIVELRDIYSIMREVSGVIVYFFNWK